MEQPLEDQQHQATIEEIEQRLFAIGARKGKDDPVVKRMLLHRKGPVLTLEEVRDIMDKALGDKSTEALDEIR